MITNSNKDALQEYFFRHPAATLRIREIEREAQLPVPSVTRYVKELVNEGVLQRRVIGNTVFYTTKRDSSEYRLRKLLANIRALHESKLVEHLISHYHNAPIRLFGSYSRGEDTEKSDIDLFIQTPLEPVSLRAFEKSLSRTIQLFCAKNVHELENKELANNILNGIPLNGYIEVFK